MFLLGSHDLKARRKSGLRRFPTYFFKKIFLLLDAGVSIVPVYPGGGLEMQDNIDGEENSRQAEKIRKGEKQNWNENVLHMSYTMTILL